MAKAEASVEELVGMIQRGQLRLPEMQRKYVWRAPRVRDLLDSLYRDYPSGAILLWDTAADDVPLQDFAVEQEKNPFSTLRLLLDGQQRLTSLSAVIRGEPVKVRGRVKPIDIWFNLDHPDHLAVVTEVNESSDNEDLEEDEADSTADDLRSRMNRMTFVVGTKQIERMPQWVRVSDVFRTDSNGPFLERAGVESFGDPRYTKYDQRLAKLRGIRKYVYRMDVLPQTMSYEEVTEIFVRVNSLGAKLRSSDLALAQITSKWKGALDVFDSFAAECSRRGFPVDRAIHLRNMVAIATDQSRFQVVGRLSIGQMQQAWDECKRGMEFALNFARSNAGIDSPALLSSPFLLVALSYFGHTRSYELSPEESVELRRWALLANAKGRYSRGSSETVLDQDLARLRDGGGASDLIDRLRLQVGRLDVTPGELRELTQGSALFKTMFLAFRHSGAKDWSSSLAIALDHSGSQHRLQFHHIFPKAVLKGHRRNREIDDIANLAFIGGRTNRRISSKAPSDYLRAIIDEAGEGFLDAQCIPKDESLYDPSNYEEFLARRRELIADRLNVFLDAHGATAARSNSDPYIRDLDTQLERVELAIRRLVATTLAGDTALLPGHILEKLNAMVKGVARKNPGSAAELDSLEGRLQYSDFRDLQDIVTSKTLWPRFEQVFGTKEAFNARCGQLATLRNTIRHSRSMSDVTQKDGEAALRWFGQALRLHS